MLFQLHYNCLLFVLFLINDKDYLIKQNYLYFYLNKKMVDIIIIGAGLSGIGVACHLRRENPDKTFLIVESRAKYGGTWDLFKYPGIRSDSNMYTFGYSFKPWKKDNSFASGDEIMNYLGEAMQRYDIEKEIQYNTRVKQTSFDSKTAKWTTSTINKLSGEEQIFESNLLFSCTGYYAYDEGYSPDFKGMDEYLGQVVHPQHWPENLVYKDKKVIIIGSGATAVTLLPKMAKETKSLVMLQRSPTYIGAFANVDKNAVFLKKILPQKLAYYIMRFKNISMDVLFYFACKRWPEKVKKFILNKVKAGLKDIPLEPHFVPNYFPWEQRFCLAPDGDFFKAIVQKKATIVTDHINCFIKEGILLKSGKIVEADLVVMATGLNLLAFGGIETFVDNKKMNLSEKYIYKGLMISDVPNLLAFVGYTNAAWTLKSDLTSQYASRLISKMEKLNKKIFKVAIEENDAVDIPLLNLNSGYILRSPAVFPKQKDKLPWKLNQNYFLDFWELRIKKLGDKYLKFE